MCRHCEGYSWEEIEREEDLLIRVHGYVVQQVQDDAPGKVWTYTVGLSENFDHPELICFDMKSDVQGDLTRYLANQVVDSGEIDPATLVQTEIELIQVHRSHLATDLVATWVNRYDRIPEQGGFLQIVPSRSTMCPSHAAEVRLFDQEHVRERGGMNRAQRRNQRRHR